MNKFAPLTNEVLRDDEDILEAISVIQNSPFKIALIVDTKNRLIGTITDGDVRRALLRGLTTASPVTTALNPNPVIYRDGKLSAGAEERAGINFAPVIDGIGSPTGMCLVSEYRELMPNAVLLMAGGKGTRLLPYTRDIPKPMVEFAGKPMIDHVIEHFRDQGFGKFFISVNHMAEQIENHLSSGKGLSVEIDYLRESEPLGTAGPIGNLAGKVAETLLVSNADIVTKCNFRAMIEFHETLNSQLTVGLREYSFQVPFGVVEFSGTNITGVTEKPVMRSQVAAGVYCVSPKIVNNLMPNHHLDMPDLIARTVEENSFGVHGFPIHETWRDVGRPEDLEDLRRQAKAEHE